VALLYPHKLALTSPTSGGCSVGIVLSWIESKEFNFYFFESDDRMQTYLTVALHYPSGRAAFHQTQLSATACHLSNSMAIQMCKQAAGLLAGSHADGNMSSCHHTRSEKPAVEICGGHTALWRWLTETGGSR
jgi:hypothetical protein